MPSKRGAAWKENQQKATKPQNKEEAAAERGANTEMVELFMLTDYRDLAKKGQVWTTDAEKAAELIKLQRAEAYDESNKQHAKAPRAN